jgi:hypothetical protein
MSETSCLTDPQKCITEIDAWHSEVDLKSNSYEGVQRSPDVMGYDPMRYFEILRHLKAPEGKLLKFVHSGARNGRPFLYWDDDSLSSADEVVELNSVQICSNHDAVGASIGVDGSLQGYFECMVFHAIAAKVLLRWHANYDNLELICNRDALEAHVLEASSSHHKDDAMRPETARRALALDPTPVVDFSNSDIASFDILTFNEWGGYKRIKYEIVKSFPHTVTKVGEKTMLNYNCLVTF